MVLLFSRAPNIQLIIGHQGRQANQQETYSEPRDFTVQRSITRSQTQARNILVSETAVMGDISKLEQQFEAFMNMYQEDKRATERRQCEMAAQLQELSMSMTNMRILKIRWEKWGE